MLHTSVGYMYALFCAILCEGPQHAQIFLSVVGREWHGPGTNPSQISRDKLTCEGFLTLWEGKGVSVSNPSVIQESTI